MRNDKNIRNHQPTYNTPVDKKIANTLLRNNGDLLISICQSSFVGNTAASVSLGVLALLRKQESRLVESFLKRLLTNRVEEYVAKGRDLNDIIRDNSLPTIMLNAYATYEGVAYLGHCIQSTLLEALKKLESCEIDPSKEGNSVENASHLIEITLSFVKSITDGKEHMPKSLKSMCYFLSNLLGNEKIHDISNLSDQKLVIPSHGINPYLIHKVSTPPLNQQPASLIAEKLDKASDMVDQKSLLERWSLESQSLCNGNEHDNISGLLNASTKHTNATTPSDLAPKRAKNIDSPAAICTISSSCTKDNRIITLGALSRSRSSSNIQNTLPTLCATKNGHHSAVPVSNFKNQSPLTTQIGSEIYTSSLPSPSRGGSIVGILTRSERVVASFLFLRFFVPAITSPESHGLLDKRLSMKSRRGLILIGKLLAALCNDVEFGSKEAYMMIMNPFLREHRGKIKAFIAFATAFSDTELLERHRHSGLPSTAIGEEVSNIGHSSKKGTTRDDDTLTLSSTLSIRLGTMRNIYAKSNISASLPSLHSPSNFAHAKGSKENGNNGSETQKAMAKSYSSEFDETANFFSFLGKYMHKIELDLIDRINIPIHPKSTKQYMTMSRNAQLMDAFFELKALIENSPYADPESKKRITGPAGLISKFTKMRLKGLFSNTSKKLWSSDDVSSKSIVNAIASSRSRDELGKIEAADCSSSSLNAL